MAQHLGESIETEDVALDSDNNAGSAGITETGADGYDYRPINALLRENTMDAFLTGERQELGNVLLAGATGFLGIHVLKDLIDNYDNHIYCFIRAKEGESAQMRLGKLLKQYFGKDYEELFGKRIFIVEGDATDPASLEGFEPEAGAFTVINCAASVKHFSKDNEIERINVGSVRNLIHWCIKHGKRIVHVSTGSVMGTYLTPGLPEGFKFDEHLLYAGQTIDDNQYVHSKFMAERIIYDAVLNHGLKAKVMRVGNLSARESDGTFQVNYKTNNFMASLAAYAYLGMIPYEAMDSITEFSPIDKVARAILLLAATPEKCICFMPSNHYHPHLGDIVMQFGSIGKDIRMVEAGEFGKALAEAIEDPSGVEKMRPFMAYKEKGNAKKPLGPDSLNVEFTVQVLYRLGFKWPLTGDDYVRKFLSRLNDLGYFDE